MSCLIFSPIVTIALYVLSVSDNGANFGNLLILLSINYSGGLRRLWNYAKLIMLQNLIFALLFYCLQLYEISNHSDMIEILINFNSIVKNLKYS